MTITVHTNNLVSLDGQYVGRIDKDSFQMPSGQRGKTTFYTAKDGDHTALNVPHEISVPVYVPRHSGSVSEWAVNPDFEAAVRAVLSA